MLSWIAANATVLQVVVSVISAVIWLVYLQIFLVGFLRQRRPEIIVSRGAGSGMEAHCFIANLGLEPVYVSQLLMSVDTPDGRLEAAISDREGGPEEHTRTPREATYQGPLKSGDSYDAGSFGELMQRVLRRSGHPEDTRITSLEITVVALSAATAAFIGAVRRYDVIEREGGAEIVPERLSTRQIRGPFARHRLRARLQRDLSWYRS